MSGLNRTLLAPFVIEQDLKCCELKNGYFLAWKDWRSKGAAVSKRGHRRSLAWSCSVEGVPSLRDGDNHRMDKGATEGCPGSGECYKPPKRWWEETKYHCGLYFKLCSSPRLEWPSIGVANNPTSLSSLVASWTFSWVSSESQKKCCCYLNPLWVGIRG